MSLLFMMLGRDSRVFFSGGVLLALAVSPIVGCGGGEIEVYEPEKFCGEVDASLPVDDQARQEAVQSFLETVRRGVAFEYLGDYVPDGVLAESQEEFFNGTHALMRWDFEGPPNGDDVPLVMTFLTDKPGSDDEETEERRTYTLSKSRKGYAMKRKS